MSSDTSAAFGLNSGQYDREGNSGGVSVRVSGVRIGLPRD